MRRKTQNFFDKLTNFFLFSFLFSFSSELLEAEVEGFYKLYIVHRTLIVVLFKLL